MKINPCIAERNRIVEKHLWCIDAVMRENPRGVRNARMEREDVYQQLALRLVQAVDSYDPAKGELKEHIFTALRAELRFCAAKPGGPTLMDFDLGNVIPFEAVRRGCLGIA